MLTHRRLRFTIVSVAVLLAFVPAQAGQPVGFDLSAYKGKVVYLDFWASWCTPCRLSFPWLNALAETLRPKGLVVIGVNLDHNRAAADQFLSETPAHFPVVYDPDGHVAGRYDLQGMPTSVLIGRDGKVHATHSGFFREREASYFSDVTELLKEGP
jgi:thiol-disulfide isomerase/thioredoxin